MKTISKKDIRALSLEDLRQFFKENEDKPFRGNQVYQWLWQKGIHDFEGMTNLSKASRSLLEQHFVINHINLDQQQKSNDGTIKNAIKLYDDWSLNRYLFLLLRELRHVILLKWDAAWIANFVLLPRSKECETSMPMKSTIR